MRLSSYPLFLFFLIGPMLTLSDRLRTQPMGEATSATAARVTKVASKMNLKLPDERINMAYSDAFRILSGRNPCSDFFGGAANSVEVLNNFVSSIRKTSMTMEV